MNIKSNVITFINDIAHKLSIVYDDPLLCDQYAWWILQSITGKTKAALLTQQNPTLHEHEERELTRWLNALINEKEPIQYLIGSVPFNDVEIIVRPPTLIPRPETEEWCINLIEQLKTTGVQKFSLLDLCCGSGCIAVAIARAFPHATIYAVDIAPSAIALTQHNAQHNATPITVLHSDLFSGIPQHIFFDLIVCNPPYIAPEEWDSLDDSVTAWEDRQALIADDHGLALIKKIITQAPHFLRQNSTFKMLNIPQVLLEIGYLQGPAVAELMHQAHYTNVIVHKDLENKDRVVSGRVDYVATTNNQQ